MKHVADTNIILTAMRNSDASNAVAKKVGTAETASEFFKMRFAGAAPDGINWFLNRVHGKPVDEDDRL
jgi:hypothetical protein